MKNYWVQFWKQIGFALPSSRFLTRKMVSLIEKDTLHHIIELGSGKGRLTEELIREMPHHVRIDLFEIDPDAIGVLKARYAHLHNVHIHHLSATEITTLFRSESIDAVISTLPLGSLELSKVHDILAGVSTVLKTGGQYIQYQYWMVNRKDIKHYFSIEKTHLEPRNWGPAFIYHARKSRKEEISSR